MTKEEKTQNNISTTAPNGITRKIAKKGQKQSIGCKKCARKEHCNRQHLVVHRKPSDRPRVLGKRYVVPVKLYQPAHEKNCVVKKLAEKFGVGSGLTKSKQRPFSPATEEAVRSFYGGVQVIQIGES